VNRRGGRLTDRAARTIITTFGLDAWWTQRGPSRTASDRTRCGTPSPPSFRAGTDLVIVADLLGHETLDTVRLYTAPDDEARANALDALITDQ
jgi:integrase